LQLANEAKALGCTRVLSLTKPEEKFEFVNVAQRPVPSLLREFSAPVNLRFDFTGAELTHLMAHDADAFNRWEAGQRLALDLLLRALHELRARRAVQFPDSFVTAFSRVLADAPKDPAFGAEALALPSEAYIAEQVDEIDPDAIHRVRRSLRRHLAVVLKEKLLSSYRSSTAPRPYSPDARSAGLRALRNLCLGYLMELDDAEARALCMMQFNTADNMTDAMAALSAVANTEGSERETTLQIFYEKWQHEPLVIDK